MSFDLLLATECNHRMVDERHFLAPDKKTVRFNRPPSTAKGIKVKVNWYVIDEQNPIYGFHFEKDPTYVDRETVMLVFNRELRDASPLIELTYATDSRNCRRCSGSKREYDPKIGPRGDYKRVIDEHKLAQMLEKWELTIKGSNKWQTILGMSLISLIGSKDVDSSLVQSVISDEFNTMESLLKTIQKRQMAYQVVSPREVLNRVSSLRIQQDPNDPRLWSIFVQFETADGTVDYIEKFFRGGKASDRFVNTLVTS